ncbi:MAG: hypothetical protein ABIQ82_03600 [Variovorax sp.]
MIAADGAIAVVMVGRSLPVKQRVLYIGPSTKSARAICDREDVHERKGEQHHDNERVLCRLRVRIDA